MPWVVGGLALPAVADEAGGHLGERQVQVQQGGRLEAAAEVLLVLTQEVVEVAMNVTDCCVQKHFGQLVRLWKLRRCHSYVEVRRRAVEVGGLTVQVEQEEVAAPILKVVVVVVVVPLGW